MATATKIFVSATSTDLRTFRNQVKVWLLDMGWMPVVQDHFAPDDKTVAEMLRKRVRECDAVVHLAADTRVLDSISDPLQNFDVNVAGWRGLVAAARASGLRDIPDPTASIGPALVRPASGQIDDTAPNRSEGARLIVDASARLALPYRPLVIATGGRLTDVADAYLVDRTVTERVVVVSSLGTTTASGAAMAAPNGEMDPWADAIVTARFRFVQVSAFYDQLTDVPTSRLSELPANAFGEWIAAKQPKIWSVPEAADQVAVVAVGVPAFATAVERVSAAALIGAGATAGPDLVGDPNGEAWLVTRSASAEATGRFWKALLGPPGR